MFSVMARAAEPRGQPEKTRRAKARENLGTAFDERNAAANASVESDARMASSVMASDAFFPFDDTVREAA